MSRTGDVAPLWLRHPVAVPVAAAFLVLALLSGLALVSAQRSNQSIQGAAQDRVRTYRETAVRALKLQTEDYKRTAATLAESKSIIESLSSGSPASLRATMDNLSTLARSRNLPAAFTADTRGRTVAFYPSQTDIIGQSFSFRDWFKGVSRTDRPYVSAGYRSAATGRPSVVAIAAPVFEGPRRVGYVVFLWQLESVREVSLGAYEDDGVSITVTDQRGQPLLRSLNVDDRGEPIDIKVSDMTRQALAGQQVSSARDGKLVEIGPVPGLGWTVTAALPSSIALFPTHAFRQKQEINLGVATLLVFLFTALWSMVARRRGAELAITEGERQHLRASEDRFQRVFDEGLTGKILANTNGEILRVNDAMKSMLGRESDELVGRQLVSSFDDDADRQRIRELIGVGDGELRTEMAIRDADNRRLSGRVALTWISGRGGDLVLLVQVEDITARLDAEKRLTELTLHDELTGLPNRRLLLERCDHAFALARSGRGRSTAVGVLFIDLDGFKKVNDRAGHDTGDQLLLSISQDLQNALRPADTVARIGGDEFVVLLEQEDGLEYLRTVADRIINTVRRQVIADGTELSVSASVGVARLDLAIEPEVRPDQLLRRADAAMYRAKERGKDRHDVFDGKLRASTETRPMLEQAIRDGLEHDRVAIVFQPVIDVDRNIVVGAEALLRLRDSTGRLLPTLPAVIAAEGAGLAEALSDRVLNLALGAACTWPQNLSVAINISARELTGKVLRDRIEGALARHAFDPTRLILEITETSILSAGPAALAELEKLRQQGVRVAIDEFGTAYATLQNLTKLPVDALKVDAAFTAGLPDQRTHAAIVHGIASMAIELNIPCIVEGVETEAQLAALKGLAVLAQGWLWGSPQGPEHVPTINPVSLSHDEPDTILSQDPSPGVGP